MKRKIYVKEIKPIFLDKSLFDFYNDDIKWYPEEQKDELKKKYPPNKIIFAERYIELTK